MMMKALTEILDDFDDEPDDPRAELVRRLLEYEQMRAAAADIDALPQAGRDFEWVQAAFEASSPPPPGVCGNSRSGWSARRSRSEPVPQRARISSCCRLVMR